MFETIAWLLSGVFLLIAAYYTGKSHGYEEGKEMWTHPSEPDSSVDTGETDAIMRSLVPFGHSSMSVQPRRHHDGHKVWFVEVWPDG